MITAPANTWAYSNRYTADKACEHCKGIIRHETWSITRSPQVFYAYQAELDASKLNVGDHITLHALGVKWVDNNPGAGACKSDKGR